MCLSSKLDISSGFLSGGENGKAARSHVIPIVVLILGAVAVIGIIVVLVKGEIMHKLQLLINI